LRATRRRSRRQLRLRLRRRRQRLRHRKRRPAPAPQSSRARRNSDLFLPSQLARRYASHTGSRLRCVEGGRLKGELASRREIVIDPYPFLQEPSIRLIRDPTRDQRSNGANSASTVARSSRFKKFEYAIHAVSALMSARNGGRKRGRITNPSST